MALVIKRSPSIGARKGYVRQNHKYIKRIPLPNGKYRYIYTQDQLQSEQNGSNQAFKPGREKNPINQKAKKIEVNKKSSSKTYKQKYDSGKTKVQQLLSNFRSTAAKVKENIRKYKKRIKKLLGMGTYVSFGDGQKYIG